MLAYLISQWNSIAELITNSKFLNAAFIAALLGAIPGACFGAWAGAYAAWRIAERSKSKQDLLDELKNTSKGILIAFNICNRMIGLKRQHVPQMRNRFSESRANLIDAIAQNKQGVFHFVADLETLTPISLPAKALEQLIFEKISVGGRPFALASMLASSEEDLKHVVAMRNAIVERLKANRQSMGFGFERQYFGLPGSDGHLDKTYPDLIESISMITDDCIFFSKTLGDDLTRYGQHVRKKFKSRFREEPPKLPEADFNKAEVLGLLPDENNYKDWVSNFLEHPSDPTRRRRMISWLKGRKADLKSNLRSLRSSY
jgi:hypothetical protein